MVGKQEYSFKLTSKKLDQKRYRPFRISKDIGQGVFQLELPEDFKGQHMEPAPLLTIINEAKEYDVKEIRKHRKQGRET